MDEDNLLKRLRQEIDRDMAPVRPLRAPATRALLPLAACAAIGALVVMMGGVRADIEVVGAWPLAAVSLLQAAACAVLLVIGIRWSIPGMSGSVWTAAVAATGALACQALLTWALLERSALSPPPGLGLEIGLKCFSGITFVSLAPLVAGAVLLMRGLPTRLIPGFALIGFASALAAEAAWRVHCPYSTWGHVLSSHWSPLVAGTVIAAAAAVFVGRPTRSPVRHA